MALSPTSSRGAPAGSVPTGGTTGQALEKASNANFDTTWAAISAAVSSVFTRTGAVVAADGDYYGAVGVAKTGAVQVSRYAGATASGAPVAGTFAVGDFVIDQAGGIWTCTAAGTPGTWAPAVPAASVTNAHVAPGAAIQASKIQGGTGASSGGLYKLDSQVRASTGTLVFSAIPAGYSSLLIVFNIRGTAGSTPNDTLKCEFNGDTTGANYIFSNVWNNGTTPTSQQTAGAAIAQSVPAGQATANRFGTGTIDIPGYASTSWHKSATCCWNAPFTDGSQRIGVTGMLWENTAAITSITLSCLTAASLEIGSQAFLYGRP